MKSEVMIAKHLRTVSTVAAIALSALLAMSALARAIEIQEVKTPAGLTVWLVEDYTVPIVSLSFEFAGGASHDPAGKAGLATVVAAMMDEGAGDLDTAALKAELEARGIEAGFSASRDAISGGMRVLADERERGFELLSMMLNQPRFEPSSFERVKASIIASRQRAEARPRTLLGRKLRQILFSGHPYALPSRGTVDSISAISRDDVIAQQKALFARDNLVIGLVGAVDREEAARLVDMAFAGLPEKPGFEPIPDITPSIGEDAHVEFDSPQTIVTVTLPGVMRSDQDFFAAYLMSHILGGGTFSSRLYQEVREKRGLVYGIGSDLQVLDHAAYISASFAAAPDQAQEAEQILLSEIKKMAAEGPTATELEEAKKYVIGSYAINNLDSSTKIADVLVSLQTAHLGMDYLNTRRDRINSVTLDEAREAARRLLDNDPTIVTIGPGAS